MPQATIKLQQAPAPATAMRKPAAPAVAGAPKVDNSDKADKELKEAKTVAPVAKVEPVLSESLEMSHSDDDSSGVPLPLFIAAAVLAFAALGIQIWTFIS
jgi:hypothetical protein